MLVLLSVKRRAIVLRIKLSLIVSTGTPAGGGAIAGATAAAKEGGVGAVSSEAMPRSARTIRPLGPLPVRAARSTPPASAMRAARGLPLSRSAGDVRRGAGVLAAGAGAASGAGGRGAGFSARAAAIAGSGNLSLASLNSAMTDPTATSSVPSAIMSFAMRPSAAASYSIVALSVSISAMRSPVFTVSPSATSHLASVPFSIVGESAGIISSIAMSVPQEEFGRGIDDRFGVDAVQAVEVGRVARLAEAVGAERAHPVAADAANPRQRRWRAVEHRDEPGAERQACEQRFDMARFVCAAGPARRAPRRPAAMEQVGRGDVEQPDVGY